MSWASQYKRRPDDALLFVPDIPNIDPGGLKRETIVGVHKSGNFVQQPITQAEGRTKLLNLEPEGRIIECVDEAYMLVDEMLVLGTARFVQKPSGYLQSYSFLLTVRGTAQKQLQKHDPQGVFKWHEADLQKLYGRRALPPIGVPQGGALSCLIANAVLHEADKVVARLQEEAKSELLYLRYCDDMILISPDRKVCTAAFAAYRNVLETLLEVVAVSETNS
jgi:hypothetical protein